MKITKFDIGAEIISIITKGMYPDPKDALREYIQNGVDAMSKNITIKVRQESVVIEDDGIGMNQDVLRKAVRMGISDKNPTKNVGFMGIGIYSAFHLCDKLAIYSRGSEDIPNKLEMDFGAMKAILISQKEKRLQNLIKSEDLVDLQTLLESHMELTEDGDLRSDELPFKGTRVELSRIEPEFYSALSDFDIVSDYLRSVIPLHFDRSKFAYAERIESEIDRICNEHNQKFEIINLKLQVNSKAENLFRPYRNIDFNKFKAPLPPEFFPVKKNDEFFGVSWGCLNSVRSKLDNKGLRGFIIKKQGFSIGRRENLVKYFPRGNTFFDRYTGEVIIVNPKILPNASRNDIEYSPLRNLFFEALADVADKYDSKGEQFQEHSKADDDLAALHDQLKKELGSYNEFEENSQILVSKIVILKNIHDKLKSRVDRKGFRPESEEKAKSLITQVNNFENSIQERLRFLTEVKKRKQEEQVRIEKEKEAEKSTLKTKTEIAKGVSEIDVGEKATIKTYESLYDLLIDMDYKIDDDLKEVIFAIDEMFIQRAAKTKSEYYELLNTLREYAPNS